MIRVYKFVNGEYLLVCEIDEDSAAVYGTSQFAEQVRTVFQDLEDAGFYPAEHMAELKERLKANYRDGYYHATFE